MCEQFTVLIPICAYPKMLLLLYTKISFQNIYINLILSFDNYPQFPYVQFPYISNKSNILNLKILLSKMIKNVPSKLFDFTLNLLIKSRMLLHYRIAYNSNKSQGVLIKRPDIYQHIKMPMHLKG